MNQYIKKILLKTTSQLKIPIFLQKILSSINLPTISIYRRVKSVTGNKRLPIGTFSPDEFLHSRNVSKAMFLLFLLVFILVAFASLVLHNIKKSFPTLFAHPSVRNSAANCPHFTESRPEFLMKVRKCICTSLLCARIVVFVSV